MYINFQTTSKHTIIKFILTSLFAAPLENRFTCPNKMLLVKKNVVILDSWYKVHLKRFSWKFYPENKKKVVSPFV